MEEVQGSSPCSSTKRKRPRVVTFFFWVVKLFASGASTKDDWMGMTIKVRLVHLRAHLMTVKSVVCDMVAAFLSLTASVPNGF